MKNLLETGTPFDYKGVDFTKHKKNKIDCTTGIDLDNNSVEDDGYGGLKNSIDSAKEHGHTINPILAPGLIVGDTDIPVRDTKYINQRQERFDDAPFEAPLFEEEG